MANKGQENLIPFDKRTEDEQREIAQKGGIASGAARREQKLLKEYANILLGLPVKDKRKKNALIRMGIDEEDTDNKMLMVAALFKEACKGDVPAAKEMRSILGEDKPENTQNGILAQIIEDLKNGR